MQEQRIELLDFVRGIAVLGILLMNIRLFSEPYAAYFSPLALSEKSPVDLIWWKVQYLAADQKFMAIFSMLFGASCGLICDKLRHKGKGIWPYYARRLGILLMLGLIHAYLIWHGDILTFYGICGFVPVLFLRAHWLIPAMFGLALLFTGSMTANSTFQTLSTLPDPVLTQVIEQSFSHSVVANKAEILAFQGSWMEQFTMRVKLAWHFHTRTFPAWGIYRVTGLMLIGLALYRIGFLTGQLSLKKYLSIGVLCVVSGFALSLYGLLENEKQHWAFPAFFFRNVIWNYWGSVLLSCGYISILALLHKQNLIGFAQSSMQNIGKTALSNYLLQSVLCSIWFYGFGQFSKTSALQSIFIIATVWSIQIVITHLWLQRYNAGPLESLWRRLSTGATKRQ